MLTTLEVLFARMPSLVWLLIGGSILTVGNIVFKFWAEKTEFRLYGAGLCLYLLGLVCLVNSFKSQNIAVASAIFVLCNIATLTLVSWLWFHEALSTRQLCGLGLAGCSVLLLM